MRKIKVQPLSKEEFAPFGEYYDYANPDGYALKGEIHRFSPTDLPFIIKVCPHFHLS